MSQDTLRERLAVVLLVADDSGYTNGDRANAVVETVEEWLAERKLRVVPDRPTYPMLFAGDGKSGTRSIYAAMVKDAPSNRAALTGKDDQ